MENSRFMHVPDVSCLSSKSPLKPGFRDRVRKSTEHKDVLDTFAKRCDARAFTRLLVERFFSVGTLRTAFLCLCCCTACLVP